MWKLFKTVVFQIMTASNGQYDPARLFGYMFVFAAGVMFLVFFAWQTINTGKFDATSFTTGCDWYLWRPDCGGWCLDQERHRDN